MDKNATPTVEMSLDVLSEVISKAAADFLATRNAIDRARADIASANTSVSRTIVADAERVVDHLKKADQALTDVLNKLSERD